MFAFNLANFKPVITLKTKTFCTVTHTRTTTGYKLKPEW